MLTIGNLTSINLGWQGENNSRTVQVDVSAWLQQWPGATIDLLVQRPGEDEFYPADTKVENGILEWKLSRSDVQLDGEGKAQMVLTGPDGLEMRSRVVKTVIGDSIDGTEGDAPAPIESWVQDVLQAANEVKASVDAGEGGLFLVRQYIKDGKLVSDRTQKEVREAVSTGKTCLCVTTSGKVHVYAGEKDYPYAEQEKTCPVFTRYYHDSNGLNQDSAYVLSDGTLAITGDMRIRTPNPYRLRFTGAVNAEYNGSSYVTVEIPDGIPDPGQPHMQLVSDEDGKAVWEERLAYKHVRNGTMTLFAEETLMNDPEEPGAYFSATPLAAMPEVGKTYEVTINGTVYNTTAHPNEEDGVQIAVVLGNTGKLNPEVYPDTGEPFMLFVPLPEHQAMMGGMSVIMVTDIAADSITLSIKGQASITDIKKIDPEYLPDTHKTITIMIDADGNVMCDTPFAEASKMTCGELQNTLKIVKTGSYGGQPATLEADVQVRRRSVEGIGDMLEITFRQLADPGDYPAAKEVTRYIYWAEQTIRLAKFQLYSLPVMDAGWGFDKQTYYLRSVGGVWQPVTIDQIKADIGHVTVRASQDVTLAISGIDKSFSDVLKALKNGAHVQLMLTRPDGFTEVYPVVGYTDTNIAFIMLPSHDTAWAIEWTESGMAKILSGND